MKFPAESDIESPLPRSFYAQPTLTVARELLGCRLVCRLNCFTLGGIITETEAYIGEDDPACHAARGRTSRTAIMYGPPGHAYVYFIYGKYYCLNSVTEREGYPAAVLIRSIEPVFGVEQMQKNRQRSGLSGLTNGPGKLCQALGIDKRLNGADLCGEKIRILARETDQTPIIRSTPRIGISAGTEKPWRFVISRP